MAVINLREYDEKNTSIRRSWKSHYFQGTTGGRETSVTLIETFLQRDYSGEWIDGVSFLYYDNEIEFFHVEGLSKIQYR
ncbi:hypothetical protein RBH29_14195 [Herbivorax sp. ANBcel31]|uniref:hypothetical protein n=1 Tax=Herbivorax sp. ANBcel31 TaxID=3069754 RepID=UPI0027B0512F|nr:hypothetical protein [Herbivorax sp. ANBcel31]MDQ2087579.1 hypothetical protein [Herbivorax sp. ANBcel31]